MKQLNLLYILLMLSVLACKPATNKNVKTDTTRVEVQDTANVVNDTIIEEEIYPENSESLVGKVEIFMSNYQFNKTTDGTEKTTYRVAKISFDDPKNFTIEGTAFEELPKGQMVIEFAGLPEVREEIVFVGHNANGYDIYAITKTECIFR